MDKTVQVMGHDAARRAVDPRLPLYLVTASADAAGSSLLAVLARRPGRRAPRAFAVTRPETWRKLAADGELICKSPRMALLPNGHVCVAAGADPVHALYQLHLRKLGLLRPRLDYDSVVVELGEHVDTGAFAAVVQNDDRIDLTYRITGIAHALDSGSMPYHDTIDPGRVGTADTIVLSGTGEPGLAAPLLAHNPFAAVTTAADYEPGLSQGWRLAPGDLDAQEAARLARRSGAVSLHGNEDGVLALAANIHNAAQSNSASGAPLRALRVRLDGEIDIAGFMAFVRDLCHRHQDSLLRLSAALNVRHAAHPVALDVIGGALLHPAYHTLGKRHDSDICMIARGLETAAVLNTLRDCRRSAAPHLAEAV